MTGPSTQTHVLIVDDEPAICRAMSQYLTRHGYRVSAVLSADAAMSIIRSENVDGMIVDFRLTESRGDTLFELAAATQQQLRTRTLFTTGDISERAQELIEACRCPLLRKPFALEDLLNWVRTIEPEQRQTGNQSA